MIGDSGEHPIVIPEAETRNNMPGNSEQDRRRLQTECRCPYHGKAPMTSITRAPENLGHRPRRSFGLEEEPTVMNPDRYSGPRQELRLSDPEQLTAVRRSIPKRPDDNPSMEASGQPSGSYMSPAYFLTIIPTNPSQPPRVVPVYPNDCLALVIIADYLWHSC
jgi:hypothetical protein